MLEAFQVGCEVAYVGDEQVLVVLGAEFLAEEVAHVSDNNEKQVALPITR